MEKNILQETIETNSFDWQKARTFYFVAKCGSFAAAARVLNTSQPSLSRQIRVLEQQLCHPLFSRYSSGVKLTRKGEEFFCIVERAHFDFTKFLHNVSAKKSTDQARKIRVMSTHTFISYILEEPIYGFNLKHPDIIFDLISENLLSDFFLHDIDIVILPKEFIEKNNSLTEVSYTPLFEYSRKLFASKEYLDKYGEPKEISDLKYHRLIGHSFPDYHPYADVNWALKLGLPKGEFHKPCFLANSIECTIKAAQRGVGIVSSYAEYSLIRNSGLKRILPDVQEDPIMDYFVCQNHLKNDPIITELKNHLYETLRQ